MKISYNWLKELLPLNVTPEELPRHLLKLGFEVSETTLLGAGFTGVVVGKVLKVEKHPNADRLKLCEVSDGKETFSVVCGASNVAEGQHIPFARIGAKLPGDFKIKKSKIRGSVSHGMICSSSELKLPENGSKDDGILVLPPDSEIGSDFGASLGEPDVILDIDVTPNRPDCLSHWGLARELAIHFNLKLTPPERKRLGDTNVGPASLSIEVADSEDCPRYRGTMIEGVQVGPSPAWLKDRLRAIGLRPINNVADITNLVLMETGQPLHAFDADKLKGEKIFIRPAKPGETLLALDGEKYNLTPENLVIADAQRPIAIAGVIGGKETSVTEGTTRVFLESANFKAARVRRSAKALGIRTDSSYRFERGTDIKGVASGAERAAELIKELCGGRPGPGQDTLPQPESPKSISVSAARINEILGADYPEDRITAVLKTLSDHTGDDGDNLIVYPPSYRLDLETPWDLAEEIGRHLGYSIVPSVAAPIQMPRPVSDPLQDTIEDLRATLVGFGYMEAYNYDFLSEKEIQNHYGKDRPLNEWPKLLNPISQDWQYLRADLLPSLLRNTRLNFNHGAERLRLFEIGRVYKKVGKEIKESTRLAGILTGSAQSANRWTSPQDADFPEVLGMISSLLAKYGMDTFTELKSADGIFHPKASLAIVKGKKTLGRFGLLHPDLLKRWDIGKKDVAAFELDLDGLVAGKPRFKPFSIFPSSSRDISILVAEDLPFSRVKEALLGKKIAELKSVELIDLFGDKSLPRGKKSVTIRLTFSHDERTLKDEDVNAHMETLIAALKSSCSAELRG